MESSNLKEAEGAMKGKKSNTHQEAETASTAKEKKLGSKEGSVSNKELYFRADKIDFKSWDVQLEKHLSRAWSRDMEVQSTRKEEWEIDLGKLDIRHVIAYGTYGVVYRGNYDGQDVAGNAVFIYFSPFPASFRKFSFNFGIQVLFFSCFLFIFSC
jgi:hypothetical protein